MTVFEKILEKLNTLGYSYEVLEHEPVHTSADAARVRDTALEEGAKALVFIADKTAILVVLPADKKVDTKVFKAEFKIKDLCMASREAVKALTALEVGSIPPTGSILGLKTYFDHAFKSKEIAVFNAGSLTSSVKMKTVDLIGMENPTFGSFSV
ncbi:MAG: YbaK/EbsC family protein [Patescibacteria group bacterium]